MVATCDQTEYRNPSRQFIVNKKVVFDTTASMVRAIILDLETTSPLSLSEMTLIRGADTIKVHSSEQGVADIMGDGIAGIWLLRFSAPGHKCLIVTNAEVGGGQFVTVTLRKS